MINVCLQIQKKLRYRTADDSDNSSSNFFTVEYAISTDEQNFNRTTNTRANETVARWLEQKGGDAAGSQIYAMKC